MRPPSDLLPALAFARDVARKATEAQMLPAVLVPSHRPYEDPYVRSECGWPYPTEDDGRIGIDEDVAPLIVLAVNAFLPLLAVAEAANRLHLAYLACCNEETACDADTDNFHGAAINLDAALAALQEVLDANAR